MEENNKQNQRKIETVSVETEMQKSFIDYAMSVIVSRAIPDARDGLKPIHRRILFAMSEIDLWSNKAYKKSAKVVGEVLAKYHPHGDQAAYEALVRMAQKFSLRYPLIDGQGNFGSIDGDRAAAMRYTETRLQKISELMLQDIDKGTVDFIPNYDESEEEPVVLPNKLPNLLINGSVGIAVGMATSIPPHNLKEIIDATIFIAKRFQENNDLDIEKIDIEDLFAFVKGPDFPTGGLILNPSEIKEAYRTGRGRAIIRSKVEIYENDEKGINELVVKEIPYAVNKSSLVQKIVEVAKKKIVDSIVNVSDQSNREGIRIVIKLKKHVDAKSELNKLFKHTPLQTSFSINLLALDGNFPRVLNLKEALGIFLKHQVDVLIRKTNFLLKKAEERIHVLLGLEIALKNIDEIIKVIKASPSRKEALVLLQKNFELTKIQADAILEMKLSRLTALEIEKLQKEINALEEEIKKHKELLESHELRLDHIISYLKEILEKFSDERRSEVSGYDIFDLDEIAFIEQKDVVVTMTETGYLKRVPIDEYHTQNRGGMGSKSIKTKEDDNVKLLLVSNTHSNLLMFTNFGRVYKLPTYKIMEASKNSKGKPIVNYIEKENMQPNEHISFILKEENIKTDELLFFTKKGIIKKINLDEFSNVNKNGKKAITLKEDDSLVGVLTARKGEYDIVIGSSQGKVVKFSSNDVRSLSRTSQGMRGITLNEGFEVVGFATTNTGQTVFSLSEKGFGKLTNIEEYRTTKRGAKGSFTQNTKKAGKLITLKVVNGNEDLIVITNKGTTIRISLDQVNKTSRATKGVKIVTLKDNEFISKATIIPNIVDDEIETEVIRENDNSFVEKNIEDKNEDKNSN